MFLHTLRVIWEIFRKIKNFIPEPETYCVLFILNARVLFLDDARPAKGSLFDSFFRMSDPTFAGWLVFHAFWGKYVNM